MKKLYITLFFFTYASLSIAQTVVTEKDTTFSDGQKNRIVTVMAGFDPVPDMLTPGHEIRKIRLQDSINKSEFDVAYFIEEYLNNHVNVNNSRLHPSFSTYISDIIINKMTDDRLSIIMQTPRYTSFFYIEPEENKHFKWKIFPETPFERNVPVFLIYEEKPDSNMVEQKIEKLFATSSFKNLKGKDKVAEQIKTVTDHFYLFFYDVLLK